MSLAIAYRDDTGRGRHPDWIGDCAQSGNLSCKCDSYLFPDTSDAEWVAVEDGFSATLCGELSPIDLLFGQNEEEIILADGTRSACLPVRDLSDRMWLIPAALIGGHPIIKSSWKIGDDGKYRRSLTQLQDRILEIGSTVYSLACDGKASTIPMEVLAQMASDLICSAYILSPLTVGRLGILDDILAPAAVMACAGLTYETVE